jgi:hypothetical protein
MKNDKTTLEPIAKLPFENPERAEVQDKVIQSVQSDPQQFIDKYKALPESFNGRYVAADLFKETFQDYSASKENRNLFNSPVHNSAAVLASAQLRNAIHGQGHPERDTVIFLTGIPGAGKTSSVLINGEPDNKYRAIYEGQLSNKDTTIPKIQEVLDAGLKAQIIVVHAKPENALDNTLTRFNEVGRGASINTMANIQGNLFAGLSEVEKKFGDRVQISIIDVRDRIHPKELKGWHNLPILQSEGSYDAIKEKLSNRIEQYRNDGKINEPAYRQAIGSAPDRRYGLVDSQSYGRVQENDRGRELPQRNSQTPQLSQNNSITPYSAGKASVNQAQSQAQTTKTIQNEAAVSASNKSLGRTR